MNPTQTSGTNGYVNSSGTYVSPTSTAPISADSLTTPAKAIVVPPAQTPTPPTTPIVPVPPGSTKDANGNIVPVTTGTSAPGSNGSTDTQSWIKSTLASLGAQLGTKSAVTTGLQNDVNLSGKTTDAAQSYGAYNEAKLNLAQQLETMRNSNAEGKFGGANAADIAKYEREGNANVANLAVIAQTSQGLLDAAQKTITDKLNAQFQPITDQIDFLTKFNAVNNSDLTASQSKALDMKIEQQKTDAANVQSSAKDIHDKLLASSAPASAYDAIDKVTNDFVNGKITAQEAQSKMFQAASGFTNGTTLTKSEIQGGSTKAGLTTQDFSKLDSNVQTYFAKASASQIKNWNTILSGVKDGSMTTDDAISTINSSNNNQAVKDYMTQQVNANAPAQSNGGGFVNWFKGLFGGGSITTANSTQSTAKGATQVINGHTYVSDGTQWVLSK